MKNVRLLSFNPQTGVFTEVICSGLNDYYKALGCDTFDIATRNVGGKWYDIFCDDEGMLKDDPVVSAIQGDGHVALVGNLIFANHDYEGNTTKLSDDDIMHIKKCLRRVFTNTHGLQFAIYPVDYQ